MSDIQNETPVTGAEVAALFNPQSEDGLTVEERSILSTLLTSDDRVDLAVPDTISAIELWRVLELCSRVFLRVRKASGQLKLLIGRALAVIQNTPDFWKSRGFSSFDAFISDEERGLPKITGISRAELYKAKAVALAIGPGMNLEDARDLGFTKMQIVAQFSEPGTPNQNALIEAAKTDTIPQLRERIARSNLQLQTGDLQWDVLQLAVTKTQKQRLQEFLNNPQVRAYCESESPGMILERMVQEVSEEWQIRASFIEGEASAV